jgi:Bacterial regulatory proteins, gntR family
MIPHKLCRPRPPRPGLGQSRAGSTWCVADNDKAKENWLLTLNHRSPVPLWAQLARELRRRIAEWSLPVGHALPPEQFLADEYGLRRSTIQQAYQAMLEAGQVDYGPRAEPHARNMIFEPAAYTGESGAGVPSRT